MKRIILFTIAFIAFAGISRADDKDEFKKKFEVFKRFKDEIYQAFTTGYSNGDIEGTNNLIKVIKRVAYGYRNFENMKLRIKIIKGCFFTPLNRKSL